MTVEASSKMAPTQTVSKKNISRKSSSEASQSSQVSRLGKLPGLSITKSGGKVVVAEGKSQNISVASKSSMGDLSHQLENQLRTKQAKDGAKEPPPPVTAARKSVPSTTQTRPSLPKSVSISTIGAKAGRPRNRSKAQPVKVPEETPAKSVAVNAPAETDNSPVMQRKRLLELIAAERAEEEKKRKLKKSRLEQRNNSTAQHSSAQKQENKKSSEKITNTNTVIPKVIKKEATIITKEKSQDVVQKLQQTQQKPKETPTNVKLEKIETFVENVMAAPRGPTPVEATSSASNGSIQTELEKALHLKAAVVITPVQLEILNKQFQVKDYLSRKEMRSLAKQTGLTDVQVRDWFKQKRFDEDVPTIIEERSSNLQLNSVQVKEEPAEVNDYGFGISGSMPPVAVDNLPAQSEVKKEPVDEDNEPDSAVLDPTTGKLFKQRTVDKDMEQILLKAPVLESLAKKIEEVNHKNTNDKTRPDLQAHMNNIIDLLDDEIEITEEHIVNPGNKEKPVSNILNKFLSQVEQLEKNILDESNMSNFQLMKENKRKDEDIKELSSDVLQCQTAMTSLEKELRDKNDEIESILLNSVSKETFVRNQFQGLVTEVRDLRKDKTEKKDLQEKIKELEKQLKNKSHEAEDWKEKFEKSVKNVKELEETSTNMIGEITKGVAEKLAAAKSKEQELVLLEEKNSFFIGEVAKLEKQIIQLNEDHYKARQDLTQTLADEGRVISERDKDIVKLKGQVSNLTRRFKEKVKEIQETLSTYNETLKMKNSEISERDKEISDLKEMQNSQSTLIKMLKDSVAKMNTERSELKSMEEELKEKLKCCEDQLQETKDKLESLPKKTEKTKQVKRKQAEGKEERKAPKVRKLLAVEHFPSPPASFLFPEFEMFRFPVFDQVQETPTTERECWPVVPYSPHPMIKILSRFK